jgi:DNA-directed RNA polymerase specialized sigma24 family protein
VDATASVTCWLEQLKAGEQDAAQPLWERYFARLVEQAERRLRGAARAVADGEDVALSAFQSFCRAARQGRYPRLADRDDLWRLLVVITERKALTQVRDQRRLKRGGGKVLDEAALAGPAGDAAGLAGVAGGEPTPAFTALVAEQCGLLLERLGDERLRELALAKMEGYTNEEIAARFDMALRTVERKLGLIRRVWEDCLPS